MEVEAQKVSSADAFLCAVSKNGRAWCKLEDPDSRCIKIIKVAKFFRAVIAAEVPVHLVSSWKLNVVATADAFADGAGLGGWWLPSNLMLLNNCSLQSSQLLPVRLIAAGMGAGQAGQRF